MSASVLLLVLFGALMHAVWNAMTKSNGDPLLNMVMVTGTAGLLALPALPFLPIPATASWPYLLSSLVLQVLYFNLLASAYKHGDMSQTYPLMRGTPPLLVALLSGLLTGEALSFTAWVAVLLICGGVFGLIGSPRQLLKGGVATGYALLNVLVIAGYTLNDGIGVRLSGNPFSYTAWLYVLVALPMLSWSLIRDRGRLFQAVRSQPYTGLIGGLCTMGSYGIALWAVTLAPIALVAALRESSILFATLISGWVLKERITGYRLASILLITTGTMVMRLA